MPVTRPDQLPPRDVRTLGITPQAVGDDWTPQPFSLWGATKLTLFVGSNPIEVQLAREQPPAPPTWDDPIPLSVGPWSHVGPFGYVRVRNLNPGAAAVVYGALYSE